MIADLHGSIQIKYEHLSIDIEADLNVEVLGKTAERFFSLNTS
jgi:hypothetical protein